MAGHPVGEWGGNEGQHRRLRPASPFYHGVGLILEGRGAC